jgi:hypothetical protein
MARLWRATALALASFAAGCGPISYINYSTFSASHAVAEARRAHAEELAPYEYTYAVEMLHKSRELAGYARWQQSVDFAKKAAHAGHQAHELAETKVKPQDSGAVRFQPHEGREE